MNDFTLRDYFAIEAMQAMIAAGTDADSDHVAVLLTDGLSFSGGWKGRIAVGAYAMADEMLNQRKVNNEQ